MSFRAHLVTLIVSHRDQHSGLSKGLEIANLIEEPATRGTSYSTLKIGEIHMAMRTSSVRNDYRCTIERNQAGKYCVRVQVHYPRHAWKLSVFFLAGSFDRAMKRLEEGLDFLQRQEEKLWFWGVDRAEDMGFSAEFLKEAGLKLDRRTEFPRKATSVSLAPERQVPAFVLGPMRRGLAESVEVARTVTAGGSPLI